jgi:hypothetical protein
LEAQGVTSGARVAELKDLKTRLKQLISPVEEVVTAVSEADPCANWPSAEPPDA